MPMINTRYLIPDIYCNFSDFMRTCLDESQAIFIILSCIWLCWWGVPLSFRGIYKVIALVRRKLGKEPPDGCSDLEKGQGSIAEIEAIASYLQNHPKRLKKQRPALASRAPQHHPALLAAHAERMPISHGAKTRPPKISAEEYLEVRDRLAVFRFPPLPPITLHPASSCQTPRISNTLSPPRLPTDPNLPLSAREPLPSLAAIPPIMKSLSSLEELGLTIDSL